MVQDMTIPEDLIDAMRSFCADNETFSLSCFEAGHGRVSYHDVNGPPRGDEGTFDAYALMEAVSDEFEFTEDSWDSFIIDGVVDGENEEEEGE